MKILKSVLELLSAVSAYSPTEKDPYLVRKGSDDTVKHALEQGLIVAQPKGKSGVNVEINFTQLGWEVANNKIQYEVIDASTMSAFTPVELEKVEAETSQIQDDLEIVDNSNGVMQNDDVVGFVIEDDIPLPSDFKNNRSRQKTPQYPLGQMQVGQSILVPLFDGEDPAKARARIRSRLHQTLKRILNGEKSDKQFYVAIVDDKHARIWRTA